MQKESKPKTQSKEVVAREERLNLTPYEIWLLDRGLY